MINSIDFVNNHVEVTTQAARWLAVEEQVRNGLSTERFSICSVTSGVGIPIFARYTDNQANQGGIC